MNVKGPNPWDKFSKKPPSAGPKFGSGKFNNARVGNRRPGARGK